jgi:hypothetical protein
MQANNRLQALENSTPFSTPESKRWHEIGRTK